jgi:predicted transposase YdaD
LYRMPEGSTLEEALPAIVRRIDERLTAEAMPEDAGKLWMATFLLTGLRTTEEKVLPLFQGVHGMKESTTYQYILLEGEEKGRAEGRAEELRKILLRQGQKRFGAPPAAVVQALESLTDHDRMERMADRVIEVSDWQELLSTPR